jgi:hypothetical protein
LESNPVPIDRARLVEAGIVAGSNPEAEYDETLAKARGFFSALKFELPASLSTREGSR